MLMDVTVEDVLALPELRECTLLCKGVSCGRVVKSITIMDNPDILDWMSEYEILLSNGSSLVGFGVLEWKSFFSGLVEKKASALFIKLNYHVTAIPEEAVSYATALDFPIVVVPNGYSWVTLSDPIQGYMIERQFYFLRESLALRDALNRAMMRGGTADDVCRIASEDMGCKTAYFSHDAWEFKGGVPCGAWREATARLQESGIPDGTRTGRTASAHTFELETSYGTVMFSKLSERSGKYYVAYCNGSWSDAAKELDAFKIEQVNIALLLCICKEEELKRIERHYYLEFLSDLLDGALDTRAEVRARSQRLGRTVHEVYQLVVAHGSPSGSVDALSDLVARFKRHANPSVRDVMCCARDALIVLFCPVVSEEDRNAISQVCEIALASMGKGPVSFGVSQPYPLTTMDKALKEASFACLVQSLVKRPVAYYADLGFLRLFERESNMADIQFMSDYYETVIGPVSRYDREFGFDLVATLRTYFEHDGSVSATAKALFIHENTLRMRLKRIEALTSRSLKTSRGSFELYLGMVMHEFIDA